jgi:lysophospholipase L1-like esterase
VAALVVLAVTLPGHGAAAPSAAGCGPADPHLVRTAALLSSDPAAVRIALVGDSTREEALPSTAGLYRRLRTAQTRPGGGLAGMPPEHIAGFGVGGVRLRDYLSDAGRLARIRAFDPTLVEISIGLNDLRVDQDAGPRVAADLVRLVDSLHEAVPGADVLLSVPAAISAVDVGRRGYVVGRGGTVNPPGAAQRVTTVLRWAYRRAAGELGYAGLNDVQEKVTGLRADTADPPRFLVDQVHPSAATAARVADTIVAAITGVCPAG